MPRPLPLIHQLQPNVYYGWFVVGGTSLLNFAVVGIGFYCMTVFLDGLCNENGWSRASVSGATSLYWVTTGITGLAIGRGVDRAGARRFIASGAIVMAVALLLLGHASAAWQLYLLYPLLAVGFALSGNIASTAIITRWFETRRARAMSIAHSGVSVGGIVIVPLATALVQRHGMQVATSVLAVLVLALALPIVAWVLRGDPADHGLAADGDAPGALPPPTSRIAPERASPWMRREALRTRTFWLLVASFGAMLFCQVAFLMHELAFLRERLPTSQAALAVSTTAAGSIVARLVVGGFADRVDKQRLGAALFCLQAASLLGFSYAQGAPALFGCALLLGFTIGNIFMFQPLIVAELFGSSSFGAVYGMQQFATQLASGLGPLVLGLLFERFGGYEPALHVLAVVAVVASLVLLRVRRPD